jgi:diacylglycerol kinase (ATP)|tara:strand:+ start:1365 stop:1745 length:381 start_codon:yes stop_codon:yes gene_type:complete
MSNQDKPTGLPRLVKALGYSLNGLRAAWVHEEAFRLEAIVSLCLMPTVFLVGDSPLEYLILVLSLLALAVAELFNSAIEGLCDHVNPTHHALIGRIKDYCAAAVFLTILIVITLWIAIGWLNWISL